MFSHEAHVDGMAHACTDCHDKLYLSKGQHKTVTMKQMRSGKSCAPATTARKHFR